MIWDAPRHKGDRVMYDGREWQAVSVDWDHHLAVLVATDRSGDVHPQVHLSGLTMSWCPLAHGGTGPPPTIRPASIQRRPCAHDKCHELIEAGERYARVVKARAVVSMHLECAEVHVGHAIPAPAVS